MSETSEVYYGLTGKWRLETLTNAIREGLERGEDAVVLNNWFEEAKVESAREVGRRALESGQSTIIIDGQEVPSEYAVLIRQIKDAEGWQVREIAQVFGSEDDFHSVMEAALSGDSYDPRLDQLSFKLVEWRPKLDMHGLREGSVIPRTETPTE